MDQQISLKETLKKDVESSFQKLIAESSISNLEHIISKAKTQLNDEINHDLPDNIISGLKKGFDLIDILKHSKKERSKKIGVAALEYLLDPWDIIPDFISDDGFLDDIYVLDRALELIEKEETEKIEQREENFSEPSFDRSYNSWLILKIGGAAGPHLAKRAEELDILNKFQRKALFDIGNKHLYGYELTKKQHTFFEALIENLIAEGILDHSCPDAPCKYCDKLQFIFSLK